MSTFRTAVTLSVKQAELLVDNLYKEHDDYNGNENSVNERIHTVNRKFLITLLTLPAGSIVERDTRYGGGVIRKVGYTTFEFTHSCGQRFQMNVYRDGTDTPKLIADVFLHNRTFSQFKAGLCNQLGYIWNQRKDWYIAIEDRPIVARMKADHLALYQEECFKDEELKKMEFDYKANED